MKTKRPWTAKSPNAVLPPPVAWGTQNINPRGIVPNNSYPDLTYSVQNCNSLNISTVCNKQLTKICAITALCTDIIFLSDIRLNSNNEHVDKVKKLFLYNPVHSYEAFFNSTKNSRGVGILISKKLNYTVKKTLRDSDENIIGLVLDLDSTLIRIFSIYGPNHDSIEFYNRLDVYLKEDPHLSIVIGGDWNATYSTAALIDNIDVLNMRSPPSLVRSRWLRQLCDSHHLSDPFRALHPSSRDFTFSPTGARSNRSRLDFFLIGDELISRVSKCYIADSLKTRLLDHKSVTLDFTRNKTKTKPFINRTIINNPRTEDIVHAAAMDSYLNHVDMENVHNHRLLDNVHHAAGVDSLQREKEKVGNYIALIKQYNLISEQLSVDPTNNLLILELAAKNTEIQIAKDNLLNWDMVTQLKLNTSDDTFLEILMGNVKGNVISFQQWVRKNENAAKSRLVNRLNTLKSDYAANWEEIIGLEDQLTSIVDKELFEKAKTMKIFECINAEKPTPLFMSLARCRSTSKKLAAIKMDDGTPYLNADMQTEGIVSYYENLY